MDWKLEIAYPLPTLTDADGRMRATARRLPQKECSEDLNANNGAFVTNSWAVLLKFGVPPMCDEAEAVELWAKHRNLGGIKPAAGNYPGLTGAASVAYLRRRALVGQVTARQEEDLAASLGRVRCRATALQWACV